MVVSNATGCTQAWGFSVPSYPYTTKPNGRDQELKAALSAWLEGFESKDRTIELSDAVIAALNNTSETGERIEAVRGAQDQLVKKSMWMYGGDGWDYDIGCGGLDHVLASGEDVNILVVDTEVYSNTGGQSSKATPFGAVAQFAAAGKRTEKKDLGMLATQYQNVYVASVALGADPAQYIKALREAEAHDGPSLIVAYAPCINHGIVKGMAWAQEESKLAVKSCYWVLYRYNPQAENAGQKPLHAGLQRAQIRPAGVLHGRSPLQLPPEDLPGGGGGPEPVPQPLGPVHPSGGPGLFPSAGCTEGLSNPGAACGREVTEESAIIGRRAGICRPSLLIPAGSYRDFS